MIDWAASSPVVDWPTEPEFAEWMAKRGEVNTEMNAGLSMMGGGTGAEALYEGDGQRITF